MIDVNKYKAFSFFFKLMEKFSFSLFILHASVEPELRKIHEKPSNPTAGTFYSTFFTKWSAFPLSVGYILKVNYFEGASSYQLTWDIHVSWYLKMVFHGKVFFLPPLKYSVKGFHVQIR